MLRFDTSVYGWLVAVVFVGEKSAVVGCGCCSVMLWWLVVCCDLSVHAKLANLPPPLMNATSLAFRLRVSVGR